MVSTEALARDAGQVLVGGFPGTHVTAEFAALAKRGAVGGAILFRRNIESPAQAQDLLAQLASLPTPEALVFSVDQEGGRVERLRAPFPHLPPMRAFGDAGRKTLARRAGALLGRTLRAVGFHQNFAPVVDVDSNPDNPVIGDRAFSRDPNVVARLGAAFIDGLQSEGVAACAKHFPGHGDTDVDSHLALPRLDHDLERLREVELVPFRAAAAADVASVMTAHIVFAALDAEHPATLSEKVLEPLIRTEIPYSGVVVSDDLEMRAIADHYGIGDAAVRAVRAGCDQLLICHQADRILEAHTALIRAVETGELPQERLQEAAARVRAFKARYVTGRREAATSLAQVLADPEADALLEALDGASLAVGPDPTENDARELELEPGPPVELDA